VAVSTSVGTHSPGLLVHHSAGLHSVAGVMEQATFFRMRRLVRRRLIAQARAQGDWRRVAYLRRMLKNGDPTLSAVRGVSEWLPSDLFLTMAFAAGWSGELGAITDTSALPEVA